MDLSPTSLLLCKENEASFHQEEEMDEFASIGDDDNDDDDDEYIEMLLHREIFTTCGLQIHDGDWIIRARLDGIHYILTVCSLTHFNLYLYCKREILGFRFQTAYLSVTYLDRFLSRRSILREKCWAIRLVSIACLSLAAKMEECMVPALSEFCLDDDQDYNFESSVIQRMELLVLNTLEWKMGSITTPFAFIHFFVKKLITGNCLQINGLSRIVQLILGAMRDVEIMCRHRPCVIAAAATLVVVDQDLTRDALQLKIAPFTTSGALKIEDVISCYYQVKELEMERLKLEEGIIKSPDLSPIQLQRTHEAGVNCSAAKRKRLIFTQFGDISGKKQKQ
ncbi:hypothetical protein BUALT_Bualt08G0043400 [Buddleja alternifolia]|uniref:Cyclin-like domain-containing protein n=1 Tax=Buddleja alternifolia TaxID=168488 RepID=A0AAV6XAT1_9LAMI|nr:hypothetical protein BUALT_Bualt08G0043400 [Buddleja alternifolia]